MPTTKTVTVHIYRRIESDDEMEGWELTRTVEQQVTIRGRYAKGDTWTFDRKTGHTVGDRSYPYRKVVDASCLPI